MYQRTDNPGGVRNRQLAGTRLPLSFFGRGAKFPNMRLLPTVRISFGASLLLLAMIMLSACQSTEESDSAVAERYQVTAESTAFYRLGPQQDSGADLQLGKGTRVSMLKRGFGFSEVELDNGWSGWLATSDVEPVAPGSEVATGGQFDNLEGNSAIVGRYTYNDTPDDFAFSDLPDNFEPAQLPDADDAFPETSLLDPQLEPVELPEFRY